MTIISPPNANDDYDETYVDAPVTIHAQSNDTSDNEPYNTINLAYPSNVCIVLNPDNIFT